MPTIDVERETSASDPNPIHDVPDDDELNELLQ